MRTCAGLALSVAAFLAVTPSAGAASYCHVPAFPAPDECTAASSPQQALDMASAHPGHDTVFIGPDTYDVGPGLVYSDGGDAGNGVAIRASTRCTDKYTCNTSRLRGGAPGTTLLSFTGGGGAAVTVEAVAFEPEAGATGLALPPGGAGRYLWVRGVPGSIGVRLEGTADNPARVRDTAIFGAVGLDATGYGIAENPRVETSVGARSRGSGSIDIRGGTILASTGVTGPRSRVTGTTITFARPEQPAATPPVGVEAACAGPTGPDAEAELQNVTIVASSAASATGVRSAAAGGDGAHCDATAHLNSTIVHGAGVSLDAVGSPGAGSAPEDGTARITAAYSNFRSAAARQTAPAQMETASPGGNVDGDPGFVPGWQGRESYPLAWNSPLVDAGDPSLTVTDDRFGWISIRNGRRDIGATEYGFNRPEVFPDASPGGPVLPVGKTVRLEAHPSDSDFGDSLELTWTLPDGTTSSAPVLTYRLSRPGRNTFHARATDSTGLSGDAEVTIRAVAQRLSGLSVRPRRFRAAPPRLSLGMGPAKIRFRIAADDRVVLHFDRARARRRGHPLRWRAVGRRIDDVTAGDVKLFFTGWNDGRRLRPGLYRLRARAKSGGPAARTRFRIIR